MLNNLNQYLMNLRNTLTGLPIEKIDQVVQLLHYTRLNNRQVFIMGNGGSASTASHFVCDLAKNTAYPELSGFKVIGLTDNMAIFSALGNDHGYDNVFVDQLKNFVQSNDVVIGISASGNSKNVIRAIDLANEIGAYTIGMTGNDGGKLGSIVQLEVRVPSTNVQHIEDIHLALEHMICSALIHLAEVTVASRSQPIKAPAELPRSLVDTLFDNAFSTPAPLVEEPGANAYPKNNPPEESGENNLGYMLQIALCSTGASSGTLILVDQNGDVVAGAIVRDGEVTSPPVEQLAEISQHGLAGWVVKNRTPALVDNTVKDERWFQRPWENGNNQSRSAVSVPLAVSGRVLGSITLVHPQGNQFTQEDLEYVTKMTTSLTPSILAAAHLI